MGKQVTISDLGGLIASHERFVILSHTRPDGDAIGSELAMLTVLEAMGKEVRALNEDGAPDYLKFLPGVEAIEVPDDGERIEAEVVMALDTANRERLGERCLRAVNGVPEWINIDHHISNEMYGDHVLVDSEAAATGEILYRLIRELDLPFPDAARDALYVALTTDTGSFQYANTTVHTHHAAADLIRRGVDAGRMSTRLYHDFPFRRVELMKALLDTLQRSADGRIAWWVLTNEIKERLGVEPGDTEGLIDILRAIRGVIVCAFFDESPDGKVRLSMRSKDKGVSVCGICAEFGGGGHALAAGARLAGPLEKAMERALAVTRQAITDATIQDSISHGE